MQLIRRAGFNQRSCYHEQNIEQYLCDVKSLMNIYAFPLSPSQKNLKEPALRYAPKNSFLVLRQFMGLDCDSSPAGDTGPSMMDIRAHAMPCASGGELLTGLFEQTVLSGCVWQVAPSWGFSDFNTDNHAPGTS